MLDFQLGSLGCLQKAYRRVTLSWLQSFKVVSGLRTLCNFWRAHGQCEFVMLRQAPEACAAPLAEKVGAPDVCGPIVLVVLAPYE